MSAATVETLLVSGDPQPWRDIGFAVDDGGLGLGGLTIRFVAGEDGLVGWSLRGSATTDLDGLPTTAAEGTDAGAHRPLGRHPNGAVGIDHVVVNTPDLDRTVAALESAGLDLRRRGRPPELPAAMAFLRSGRVILEVVERPEASGPARFWGLVVVVEDLEACARSLGDRLGAIRDAVQPGRRIATVREEAGVTLPVAFMTPRAAR